VISELTAYAPQLAADSVIEMQMAYEIPREADQLDYHDED
jgi:hypothetical protein